MGMGTFNLMISLLPARVIKLLEFIGFSGNKRLGMQDLYSGANMSGLRQVLCVMTLLGYNLIVCYVLSHQEGDLVFCEDILKKQLVVSSHERFHVFCCFDFKLLFPRFIQTVFGFYSSRDALNS